MEEVRWKDELRGDRYAVEGNAGQDTALRMDRQAV